MRLSTAFFCLVATIIAFAAIAVATTDPPVVEVLHTTIQSTGSNQKIGFFGQFNSPEFINSTNVYAQLTTGTLPEGFTATNVTMVFRRHHCNCWVQDGSFIPNKAEFQAFPFKAAIEDDSMTFMGYIEFTSTKDIPLGDVEYTLTFSSSADGKTTPHVLKSTLALGYKSMGHVLSVSGPRAEIFNQPKNVTETPISPQIMFSDFQLDALNAAKPQFLAFTPIGRFQFRLGADETVEKKITCTMNGLDVEGTVSGTEFETKALFDLSTVELKASQSGFFSFHCLSTVDTGLFPTNAVDQYKYDLSFFSFDWLDAEQKSVGIGDYASLNNVPDAIPTKFTTVESYQDDDVIFCKYDLSYQQASYVPSDKQTDPTMKNSSGKDLASFYFANLEEDKVMGVKANSTIRVDVARTVYKEKYALNIPKNATLHEQIDAKVLAARDIEYNTKRFANLTDGISFSSFINIGNATIENPQGVECAMVLSHPNGQKEWQGTGLYATSTRPTIYPAAADKFVTKFNLVTEKATFNTTFVGLKINTQELVQNVTLTLPAQNWIFSGNYTTCKVSVADKTYPMVPTIDDKEEERSVNMIFTFSEETAKTFKPEDNLFIDCPNVKLVPMNPSFEFVHESGLIRGLIQTDKELYSSSELLGLYPSKRWVTIIFIFFISIMILSAALMVICFTRCIFLTCTKKEETPEDQALLLNNGYSLE